MNFGQLKPLYRFLLLLVLSAALMIVDHRSQQLAPARVLGSAVSLPFRLLMDAPSTAWDWFGAHYPDDSLHQQYKALQAKQLVLEARLQGYDTLEAENRRLLKLLASSRRSASQALLAEIIEIGLEPFTQQVALNRGIESGVYLGQPVITVQGVLGQVSGLGLNHCVVTLITNPNHSIPVQIQRNGLHTIAQGRGASGRVAAPFLPGSADIRVGDVLITSGIGGRFPAGYKVAQVQSVTNDANQAFLGVDATAFASAESTREALLLSSDQRLPVAGGGDDNDR